MILRQCGIAPNITKLWAEGYLKPDQGLAIVQVEKSSGFQNPLLKLLIPHPYLNLQVSTQLSNLKNVYPCAIDFEIQSPSKNWTITHLD